MVAPLSAPRSLLQLLVEALQDPQPGMAQNDPAEIARRYPQGGATDSSDAEPTTRFPPPVDVPRRDPNVRQLSRAPFAAGARDSIGSSDQSFLPHWVLAPLPQNLGSAGAYSTRSRSPWGTPPPPPPPPFLPGLGGRLAGGLGRSSLPPPWPTGGSEMPGLPFPDEWKGAGWKLVPLLRSLMGEGGERKVGDTAAGWILDLHQEGRRGTGSNPPYVGKSPSIVPDVHTDVPEKSDEKDSRLDGDGRDGAKEDGEEFNICDKRQFKEEKRCRRHLPKSLRECINNAEIRKNQCYANGRRPDPNERILWNRAQEEAWFNQLR